MIKQRPDHQVGSHGLARRRRRRYVVGHGSCSGTGSDLDQSAQGSKCVLDRSRRSPALPKRVVGAPITSRLSVGPPLACVPLARPECLSYSSEHRWPSSTPSQLSILYESLDRRFLVSPTALAVRLWTFSLVDPYAAVLIRRASGANNWRPNKTLFRSGTRAKSVLQLSMPTKKLGSFPRQARTAPSYDVIRGVLAGGACGWWQPTLRRRRGLKD